MFGALREPIGKLLVRDGLITHEDVRDALAVAIARGLRVVSALVAIGRLDPDEAARALGRQLGVPAALTKHLEGRDVALAALLPASLARALEVLPIAVQRTSGALVVCARDPSSAVAARVAEAAGRPVVLAVAPSLLLAPLVERTYAQRPPRAATPPPVGEGSVDVPIEIDAEAELAAAPAGPDPLDAAALQLVDLDDHGVEKQHAPLETGSGSFPALPPRPARHTAPPPAAAPAPPPVTLAPAPLPPRTLALDPAIVAVTAASDPDEVVGAIVAYLRHRFEVGIVFVVREGIALGQAGFGGDVVEDAILALAVPLAQPSVLRHAHDRAASYVGAPVEGGFVQERLFRLFGAAPAQVVVVPVVIRTRVVNLIYGHGARGIAPEEAAIELGTLASAAEDAFVRIIRESKA